MTKRRPTIGEDPFATLIPAKGARPLPRVKAASRNVQKSPEALAPVRPAVLDKAEAAIYLKVSVTTVLRLVRSGELPHTRVGRSIRFRPADLDAYLESRTQRTAEEEAVALLASLRAITSHPSNAPLADGLADIEWALGQNVNVKSGILERLALLFVPFQNAATPEERRNVDQAWSAYRNARGWRTRDETSKKH
jgi:excisionase family DNA binding protein